MGCSHDRLRTVGNRVFCCNCNEELPIEFLTGKNGENPANNPAPAVEKDKPSTKKRTPKKAV